MNTLFNRLAYFFGFLAITSAAVFSYSFTQRKIGSRFLVFFLSVLTLLMSLLSLTDYVAGKVSRENGELVFTIGPLVYVFGIAVAILIFVIVRNFYLLLKKGNQLQKNQAQIIMLSFVISILIGMTANIIIPIIADSFATAKYGPPLLSAVLIMSIAYAIIRHQLFDIRLVVARSVAYVLLLGTLAIIFAAAMFTLTSLFFSGENITIGLQIAYMSVAVGMAIVFQPLKRFFDHLTNNIFYRDAYDPQALLDELNSELVNNIDLQTLLSSSGRTISKYLKSDFTGFAIHQPGNNEHRVIGMKSISMEKEEFKLVHRLLHPSNTRVLLTDDFVDTGNDLLTFFQKHAIAATVVLVTHKQEVGFLFLGEKKSGNIYSGNDRRMMEIIGEELAIAIQNALRFEEIEQFNVTLQQKIDDATVKLKHANTRLKELDEAKDEFVSMASHQLRTPLTVIKGYLSMLLEGDMGKVTKQQKEIIQTAYDGAERMVFLIGDLLNVSRLQTGKFQIENQLSDLSSVIDHEVSHLQESAANHQLKLTFNKPKDFPKFMLDETKIRQVIMNFIDNAIYYTPAGGSIDVRLESTDHEILFTVNDTGLGVPKSEQHHLFSKFYRAGNARKMRPDGTGLGLYMAKKIIVAQGGAIIFKSEEGKGSSFGFSLPKKAIGQ